MNAGADGRTVDCLRCTAPAHVAKGNPELQVGTGRLLVFASAATYLVVRVLFFFFHYEEVGKE